MFVLTNEFHGIGIDLLNRTQVSVNEPLRDIERLFAYFEEIFQRFLIIFIKIAKNIYLVHNHLKDHHQIQSHRQPAQFLLILL